MKPLGEGEKHLTPPASLKTKEEIFYWRLKNDSVWYAENFLKIRNKKSKLVPLKLNCAQSIIERIDRYCIKHGIMRRYIILKARQMGISTYTESKIFQETANNEFVRSMIIAHEEKASTNLFQMSKLFYEELDDVIQPMKKYSNGRILAFENPTNDESEKRGLPGLRSNITIATAGTGEVGRSATPTKLHISELAFFPDAKTTMMGLLQGVPDTLDSLVILESTANGIGDYFHEMWQAAVRGKNDFIPIFLPWFIDPEYSKEFDSDAEREQLIYEVNQKYTDHNGKELRTYEYELMVQNDLTYEQLNWRRATIANKCQGDEELFCQEYPSTPSEAFIVSGRPRFDVKVLKKYQTYTKPPLMRGYLDDANGVITFREDNKGYVSIWKKPENRFYVIGADVAEGLKDGDFSCGLVGDEDFMVVAMWHGHIDPDLFGKELIKLAKYFNQAYIGVEANNHGLTTLKSILRDEYWNIYYQKIYDRMTENITTKLGWTTTSRTKPLLIDKLSEFIREMYIGIFSETIIGELFTYVIDESGKTNAQQGCFDDTVIALGIMLQLLLEGKGDNYVPEVPYDEKKKNKHVDEVIDELFEKNSEIEYTI